jgi:aminopeptidase N
MRDPTPQVTYLKDYAPPAYLIDAVDLDVELFADHARVRSRLSLHRNPKGIDAGAPLRLDAEELEFESATLDGKALGPGDCALDASSLTLARVPGRFTLETACRIFPHRNTTLMGLYAAESGFSHSASRGFRRISPSSTGRT